jgi:hypothetical protein
VAKQPRQGRPFERRNGQEGFAWEGVATKVDPAANPPNRPRDLLNVRLQGGDIISRPPFSGEGCYIPLLPIYYTGISDPTENPPFGVFGVSRWTPHWLGEHNSAAGTRLWLINETLVPNDTIRIEYLDTDADRGFQLIAALPSPNFGVAHPIEKFNNEFYYGDSGGLRKLYLIPSVEGSNSPPVDVSLLSDEVVVAYPTFETGALQEYEGKLFFSLVNGPSFGEVYNWNGLGVTFEFTMTASGASGCVMALYKDTLVVAMRDYVGAGQGALLVRDAAGGWTTATLLGFNPSRYPNSMVEYGDLLYILDSANNIFTWDGSVIALAHTLPIGGTDLNVCAKLSGRLYFAWSDVSNGIIELGYVDQDNPLLNKFVDQGTEVGVFSPNEPVTAMAQYRGRLWLAFNIFPSQVVAWHSTQFMPYAGWQFTQGNGQFTASSANGVRLTNMRTL